MKTLLSVYLILVSIVILTCRKCPVNPTPTLDVLYSDWGSFLYGVEAPQDSFVINFSAGAVVFNIWSTDTLWCSEYDEVRLSYSLTTSDSFDFLRVFIGIAIHDTFDVQTIECKSGKPQYIEHVYRKPELKDGIVRMHISRIYGSGYPWIAKAFFSNLRVVGIRWED